MLKRLCCCLSLLLSLCLLFPVFSVSTYAISVDGYDVSTRVVNESGVYEEFTNTIVFNSSTNQLFITVDIELPEVILENTIFDLEVEFSIGDYLTISEFNGGGTMYDSNWVQLEGRLDGIVRDGKLIESQIVALGDIKYIRYVFDIYNPYWDYLNSDIITNLTNSTWRFGEYLYGKSSFSYNVNYDISMNNYIIQNSNSVLSSNYYTDSGGRFYFIPAFTWHDFDGNFGSSAAWLYQNNRIASEIRNGFEYLDITFTGGTDVTNADLIAWLEENATLQSSDNQSSKYTFDFSVTSISLTQEDNTGEIGGILGWIQRIFSAIADIPNQIGKKLTSFGEWLIDRIKGLFIPSEETIIELKDKFEALLADRFGAAYQSIEVVEQFGQAMGISTYSDTVDTITFPSVTVPLAGTEFTFGGWEVDIVPKGFEGLITPLKLIVDLVCTIACVNMFRRRMEGVLR